MREAHGDLLFPEEPGQAMAGTCAAGNGYLEGRGAKKKKGRNYTQGRKLYSQHEKETTLILQPEWCKVLQSGFSHLTEIHHNLEHNPPVFTFLKGPQTQPAQHKVAKRVSPLPRSHKKRGGKLSVNLCCLHFIQQEGKKCMHFSLLYISMGKEGGRGFRSL